MFLISGTDEPNFLQGSHSQLGTISHQAEFPTMSGLLRKAESFRV
jgi:hypothetical protein